MALIPVEQPASGSYPAQGNAERTERPVEWSATVQGPMKEGWQVPVSLHFHGRELQYSATNGQVTIHATEQFINDLEAQLPALKAAIEEARRHP